MSGITDPERNYHIFYMVLSSPEERKFCLLDADPHSYRQRVQFVRIVTQLDGVAACAVGAVPETVALGERA